MRTVRFGRLGLAVGFAALAMFAGVPQGSAQQAPKIEITPQIPHTGAVTSLAFSPDGTRLASGGADKTLKLWDAATGQLIRTFVGHTDVVTSVAFSPDGAHLVSASGDQTLKLWDAASAQLIHSCAGHSGKLNSVVFSPDGSWVLSGSADKTMKLWDAAAGTLVRTFAGHTSDVISVAFSPDGRQALSHSYDNTMKLWDAATGSLVHTFEGPSGRIEVAAFSPDGSRVLSASADTTERWFAATIKLWDAVTGAPLQTFEAHPKVMIPPGPPRVGPQRRGSSPTPAKAAYSHWTKWVAFSPDGSRIGSSSANNTMKLWDAATGGLVHTFEGHSSGVSSVAFSADGARVLSGSSDGMMKLWDTATGALLRTFKGHAVRSVAFSADGSRVLSGTTGTATLWNAETASLLRTLSAEPNLRPTRVASLVAFSRDGSRAVSASSDGTMKMLNLENGALVHTFGGNSEQATDVVFSPNGTRLLSRNHFGEWKLWNAATGALVRAFGAGRSALFSPDGSRVVSHSGYDKTVELWDATTGVRVRTFVGHSGGVDAVAFSPDGTHVLSGSDDKTVKLWDAASGGLVRTLEGHSSSVWWVAFSADGSRVLSRSRDKTAILWEAATGTPIRSAKVNSAAFSPGGSRVVSQSYDDSTIGLWDAANGALLRTLGQHFGQVSVAFSPDGGRLLSKSDSDWTMKLWDATTGALLRSLGAVSVVFSRDGSRLLSYGGHTIKLWDAATGALVHTFEGHFAFVISAAFSLAGHRVISVSDDGTTRIWDATTGAPLAVLIDGRGAEWLAMTSAGFFAASRNGTEMLGVVRGLVPYSVMQFYDHLYRPDLVEEALKGDPEGKHKDAAFHLNLEKILDSGPAPRIEHLEKKTERAGDTVKLAVSIVDTGGGIGPRVVWRVNGQTQGRVEPAELKGAQAPSLSAFTLTETFRIDPSKENMVELTAYNGTGLLAAPPFRIAIDKFGATAEERPRMHVLAVGVDKYRMPDLELKYAVKDTLEFSKALQIAGSSLFGKVETTVLRDEEATESAIASAFDRIGADAKTGDVFVLYLAGHGKSIEGKYYYYPQTLDFKAGQTVERHGIGQDKWQTWLAKVGHVNKSVLILDTCYAGAAAALVRGDDSARQTAIDQLKRATGQNLIAASRQAAFEGYKGHGVLTYTLLEALHKTDGASSSDTVGVTALAGHISGRVPAITQELFGQHQSPIRRLSGDDFPIGVRQAVLRIDDTIPKSPTHMLIRAERVRERPATNAQGKRELGPGTMLRVVEFESGWAVIARDGERLGYVPAEALLKMQ